VGLQFYFGVTRFSEMSRSPGYGIRSKITSAAEKCEPLWLLAVESEYIGFLVSLESEKRVLEHIASCEDCRRRLRTVIEKSESEDELDEVFHRELNNWRGESSSETINCPLRDDFQEIDSYIDARIMWRIGILRKLSSDAELELGHLSERIKDEQKRASS
jgi:hypothetical protein